MGTTKATQNSGDSYEEISNSSTLVLTQTAEIIRIPIGSPDSSGSDSTALDIAGSTSNQKVLRPGQFYRKEQEENEITLSGELGQHPQDTINIITQSVSRECSTSSRIAKYLDAPMARSSEPEQAEGNDLPCLSIITKVRVGPAHRHEGVGGHDVASQSKEASIDERQWPSSTPASVQDSLGDDYDFDGKLAVPPDVVLRNMLESEVSNTDQANFLEEARSLIRSSNPAASADLDNFDPDTTGKWYTTKGLTLSQSFACAANFHSCKIGWIRILRLIICRKFS